jgi:hydroxymethylglutaryl-CoA lyase
MLNGMGINTGVDIDKLAAAGRFIAEAIHRPTVSKVAQVLASR